MKIKFAAKVLVLFTGLLVTGGVTHAQEAPIDDSTQQESGRTMGGRPGNMKRDLMAQLGLTPEQMEQIRRMNMARRPLMMEAQMRLRTATKALDDAIYAEQVNEADVQTRLREFQLAQSDVAKVRFESELSMRKILTPEQLLRFRELRRRFEEQRRGFKNNDGGAEDTPMHPGRRRGRIHQTDAPMTQTPPP